MKILLVASEAAPYIASGGLADVVGALPKALNEQGNDCRVVLPKYQDLRFDRDEQPQFLCWFMVNLSWRNLYCGVFKLVRDGVTYYFLDNEYYFKRSGLYGYFDDCERFAFFSKAVLEALVNLDFEPDVIHCNDWQTALVPVYLNTFYRGVDRLSRTRTVFTIHNIQYQGIYGFSIFDDVLGLPEYVHRVLEYDGDVNLLKGAIESSDAVNTVSPSYAQEILNPYYGHGLDQFLVQRSYKLRGILNGIDNDAYNPQTDESIPFHYDADAPEGKAQDKQALLKMLGLPDNGEPVIGMVGRLVSHKGLDLVKFAADELIQSGCKLVLLGSGEYVFESFFKELESRYPQRVSVTLGFIPDFAHKIYAGADMFLMPSQSEPCGLAQMIALRYGTIPIVRETGGLKDSIRDAGAPGGNGFTFKTYNAGDMMGAIYRAHAAYDDKARWEALVDTALRSDFSWSKSAGAYAQMYADVCKD